SVGDVAGQFESDVAVGRKIGGKAALQKSVAALSLQALQPKRHLELAGAQTQLGQKTEGDPAFLKQGPALSEVREDAEVDEAPQSPLHEDACAAEQQLVEWTGRNCRGPRAHGCTAGKIASVGLHQPAQPQAQIAVVGADDEALIPEDQKGNAGAGRRR